MPSANQGFAESASIERTDRPPDPADREARALYYTQEVSARTKSVAKDAEAAASAPGIGNDEQEQIDRSVQRFIQRIAAGEAAAATTEANDTGQSESFYPAPQPGQETLPAPASGGTTVDPTRDFEIEERQEPTVPPPVPSGDGLNKQPQQDQGLRQEAILRSQERLNIDRLKESIVNVKLAQVPPDPSTLTTPTAANDAQADPDMQGQVAGAVTLANQDILETAIKAAEFKDAVINLQQQAQEHIERGLDPSKKIISAGVVVSVPTLAGLGPISHLIGQMVAVPGAEWLRVEINMEPDGNDLMLGLHVDLEKMLEDVLKPSGGGGGVATPVQTAAEPPPDDKGNEGNSSDKEKGKGKNK